MSLNVHELLDALNRLTAGYPKGEISGLLGAIAQRENGGRAILSPSRPDARLVSISGGNDPNPYVVTVTLYRRNTGAVPANSNHLPQAKIAWGAGKSAQTVVMDFLHGARVTMDCSSLTIDALYNSNGSPAVGPEIECFAGVVYGSLGSQLNTLTQPIVSLDGASGFFGAPQSLADFGNEVKVFGDDPAATYTVNFGHTVTVGRADIQSSTTVGPNQWVQIPNGMEFVDVQLASGASTFAGLQYLLSL